MPTPEQIRDNRWFGVGLVVAGGVAGFATGVALNDESSLGVACVFGFGMAIASCIGAFLCWQTCPAALLTPIFALGILCLLLELFDANPKWGFDIAIVSLVGGLIVSATLMLMERLLPELLARCEFERKD